MEPPNDPPVVELDLPDPEIRVSTYDLKSNSILHHPSNNILNYALLDLLKETVCSTDDHALVIASSEYAVKQHILFFRRHLLTNSIGSCTDAETNHVWPKILVREISSLHDIYSNGLKLNLKIVIVLDCHDVMQHKSVIKFVTFIKELEEELKPKLHCFTSCVVPDGVEAKTISYHVRELEEFYGCKLMSLFVPKRSSSSLHTFNVFEQHNIMNEACVDSLKILNAAEDICTNFNFQFNEKISQICNISCDKYVKDTLTEIQNQMQEFGEYGGSIAALAAFRTLVRLYTFSDSSPASATKLMLSHLVCTLAKFRKILEDDMFRVQLSERAERFSSQKVQSLLKHLKGMPRSSRALVLVKDLNTASILTLILQKIASQGKVTHLKPELMMNTSCVPVTDSWEHVLSWERTMNVYSRFISERTNTIILSGKLQGLDLPNCDLVFAWDQIENFSEFLQAQYHVRDKSGELFLFVERSSLALYQEEIKKFDAVASDFNKILIKNLDNNDEHCGDDPFKSSSGTAVNSGTAISLLKRYCEKLSLDKFTSGWPMWEIKKCSFNPTRYCAFVYLPRSSPIHCVKSDKMTSWQAAQANAALKACQKLFEVGELDDSVVKSDSLKHIHFMAGDPNTGSMQRDFESNLGLQLALQKGVNYSEDGDILCDIIYPQSLMSAQPRPNADIYVHRLVIGPVSEPPPPGDNRKAVLYELLHDKSTFAILSSKPLAEVCDFPVFLFSHELSVKIETLSNMLSLNQSEIFRLIRFHCGLFMKVLPIVQYFMYYDRHNTQNSYLIAPLTADGAIDWDVVDNNTSIPACHAYSHEEKKNLVCTPATHEKTIVKPYYRLLTNDQVYLVSKVCTDMSSESCFPTEEFDSFYDYYRGKYGILLERPELPLLEAYLINTKVNGLLPRPRIAKMRREEKMEAFREHMVPELCTPLLFPAALWLKLSSLPSVLHRLHRLLLVEDFRQLVVAETGVGAASIDLHRLAIDKSCLGEVPSVAKVPPSLVKRGLAIGNVKLEDRKRRAQLKKPWKDTQEPVDIHRHLESLNFVEMRYFDEFIIKSRSSQSEVTCVISSCDAVCPGIPPDDVYESDDDDDSFSESVLKDRTSLPKQPVHPECIALLQQSGNDTGPQQSELLAVFTSTSSNDGVNMDHIQVLGNSVLNMIISVFAFQYGSSLARSCTLTCLLNLRTAFMSKNHLEACSIRQQICNRIKVLDFTPGEWIPPCFVTPSMLKIVLKEQEISPNVLQKIKLTEEEQLSGVIDATSENDILDVLSTFVNSGSARREEVYVDRQYVPGQTAASCVEALVGTYYKNCGWQGALKIVSWLRLLPSDKLQGLLELEKPREPVAFQFPVSLPLLEHDLDYNFNDKTLLVQAVTHVSFINPLFQGYMDTLSFLGGSILDFLLTCYIWEHFNNLNPSEMRCLREFLSTKPALAYLAVRHGFHKHLLSNSASLLEAIDRFVKLQKGCEQPINDEVQLLLEEHESQNTSQIEVPDALGKLVPSLVGAVYLDCGKNLLIVWNTFKSIFLPELGLWCRKVPLSVVELLEDLSPAAHQVTFSSNIEKDGRVKVSCKIQMDNTREEVFVALGYDESKTKTHAAKLALRNILESNCCY